MANKPESIRSGGADIRHVGKGIQGAGNGPLLTEEEKDSRRKAGNRERQKKYREAHPERKAELAAYARKWRAENWARRQETRKKWEQANREPLLEARRKKYEAHPEKWANWKKAYRAANPEKMKEYERSQYQKHRVRWLQNGAAKRLKKKEEIAGRLRPKKCEICKQKAQLFFDHCHASNSFRGWICMKCNSALGLAGDSPSILRRMAKYVEKHSQGTYASGMARQ